MTAPAQTAASTAPATERRIRGIALIAGAAVMAVLISGGVLPRYWFPLLTGLTYLVAAGVSRSRGTLWAPGFIISTVGLSLALWLRDGKPADSFELLALAVLSLGLGGVLAALLGQLQDKAISAMSVALSVLLLGAFLLLEQQAIAPFAGHTWPFIALLAIWGLYELRPVKKD